MRKSDLTVAWCTAAMFIIVAPRSIAQNLSEPVDAAWVREHYTKTEHMVPMRDGVRLHTAVYAPKDDSQVWPFMMIRTPYSCRPYGEDSVRSSLGPNARFARDRFIFVYQDVRGAWNSEGEFLNMRPHIARKSSDQDVDESTDCYDTVAWLIANIPNNNGRVGMWGISYPGFYAAASMIDAHPALVAVSPQAPIADWWYDDFHHHGAFFLPHCFRFISSFGQPRPEPTTERPGRDFEFWTEDGYQFYMDMGPLKNANEKYLKGKIDFWNKTIEHPNYDAFWQSRNILPHLHHTAAASMIVGGWFDAEDLYGPLQIYREVEKNNPGISNTIVMGPGGTAGGRAGRASRSATFTSAPRPAASIRKRSSSRSSAITSRAGPRPTFPKRWFSRRGRTSGGGSTIGRPSLCANAPSMRASRARSPLRRRRQTLSRISMNTPATPPGRSPSPKRWLRA